ncbi:HAD-IIB family hydrolase [Marinobacter sp. VGCF2001]|uniref:HAD-IIB family hydrolase n=1 Tax=Marinobacter sp. VGCF2001 TaxID=3417189 RepID=UPI003CF184CB
MQPHLIVFTDLDGTLLDHHSYSWRAASPAMAKLAANGIPLIFNSSKTAAEMRQLQSAMGIRAPFIVENGAAVVIPAGCLGRREEQVVNFGADHAQVWRALMVQRESGAPFRGFSDMSNAELAGHSGLGEAEASRARQRLGTEPLIWQGSSQELGQFRAALEHAGLRLLQGGRFWHAMGRFDKAEGARFLLQQYQEQHPGQPMVTIALGDSPNDQRMLEAADIPVVIRGLNSDQLHLPSQKHPMRSLKPGPEGWNECVLNLLFEYGY